MTTPLCILLVDDSAFFLRLERQFLLHTPATIIEAQSGAEALDLARRYRPSLVYMDIDMPGIDGLACSRQFRDDEQLRAIPLVLIGDGQHADWGAEARAAGCAGYLEKPLDRRQFLDVGHRLLVSIERRETRRTCYLPVTLHWQGREFPGLCKDVSSGGLFLKVIAQIPAGAEVQLQFRLPDVKQTAVRLGARVSWVNDEGNPVKANYPAGLGLEFVEIDEATGIALRRCFGC